MDALLGRCHGRIRTCLEPGAVLRPNQNYFAYFSGCFRGTAYLDHLDTFLLYFTYFIVKIFGRCYKKKQHDFSPPLALKGPVLLEYSKLQAHIIKYSSNNGNWEKAKWIRIITPVKCLYERFSNRKITVCKGKSLTYFMFSFFASQPEHFFLSGSQMGHEADICCSRSPGNFSLSSDYC